MNGNEYLPNSNKSKAEQKAANEERKVEKIVQGPVKAKKKGGFRKFTDNFITGDKETVKSYIFVDLVIPTIKKFIWEALTGSLDIAMNGKSGSFRNSKPTASTMSYNNCYNSNNRTTVNNSARARGGYSCDDIIFTSRGEAEGILSQMIEMLIEYEGTPVSVQELYTMCGLQHTPTDCKWGWKDLSNAYVERRADGYALRLPRPMPIVD